MTTQIIRRLSISSHKKVHAKENGITLLLALLVLASVSAIVFSMAGILYTEIRVSGDNLKTEAAYQAAIAISEEQNFILKRRVLSASTTPATSIGSVSLNNPPPVVSATNTPAIQVRVKTTDSSFLNTTAHFPMYDTSNSSGGSGYGYIRVTYLPTGATGQLRVYLCQFNPGAGLYPHLTEPLVFSPTVACSNSENYGYWLLNNTSMDPVGNPVLTQSLDSLQQQELILVNPGLQDIYVLIETFSDTAGLVPLGLPYSGYKTIDITAVNSGVNRKIQIKVPNTQ